MDVTKLEELRTASELRFNESYEAVENAEDADVEARIEDAKTAKADLERAENNLKAAIELRDARKSSVAADNKRNAVAKG